jgi:hypothetical protein
MPRRRPRVRRNRRPQRRSGNQFTTRNPLNASMSNNRVITVPGSAFLTLSGISSTPASIVVNQLIASGAIERLGTIGKCFTLARVVSLSVSSLPLSSTTTIPYFVFGYQPGNPTTSPMNVTAVSELENVLMFSPSSTTVPQRLVVSRRELLGQTPLKWFTEYNPSSVDVDVQGLLWFATTGSSTYTLSILIQLVVEYCSPTYTGDVSTFKTGPLTLSPIVPEEAPIMVRRPKRLESKE